MNRRLDEIRTTEVEPDFIAGESSLDEQLVRGFFVDNDLEELHFFNSADFPTLFRTTHRLAKDSGVPLLNLTGSAFSVASGAELEVPFGERNVGRPDAFDADDESETTMEVAMKPEGFEVSWRYSLALAIFLTLTIGFGSMGFGVILATADGVDLGFYIFVAILALIFALPTVLITAWLLRISGTHRLLIDGEKLRYSRPMGAEKSVPLDELLEVYLRPNVSGGMSGLLLLSATETIIVYGKLPDLQAIDRAIRGHFVSLQPEPEAEEAAVDAQDDAEPRGEELSAWDVVSV